MRAVCHLGHLRPRAPAFLPPHTHAQADTHTVHTHTPLYMCMHTHTSPDPLGMLVLERDTALTQNKAGTATETTGQLVYGGTSSRNYAFLSTYPLSGEIVVAS